jgi:phage antirepressor YoqD-like protein
MNTMILPNSAEITMTSREIADLVESRHDHVKTSIERLAKTGAIQLPSMRDVKNDKNQTVSEFVICKRDTYVIVAQLSPQFTARLVDRWLELEGQNKQFAIPTTLSSALRLAAEQAETIEHQAQQLAEAKPHIEFVERYVDASGSKGFRQVCKLLGANENRFREFLLEQKIMYRLGAEWVPHAQHLEAKRFEVKAGTSDSNHAFNQARFTPKGINWVAGLWAQYNLHESAA